MDDRQPHPRNVAGPFYVVHGCCTTCGVPELAPDSFAFASDGHCFVERQPEHPAELEKMLRVVRTQELGCIRCGVERRVAVGHARGSDPRVGASSRA